MATTYTPTEGVLETGKNIRTFLKENKESFWIIWKPLMNWVAALAFIDLLIHIVFFPQNKNFALFQAGTSYIYMGLAVAWHRLVIEGPALRPVNILKPTRNELLFFFMGIGLGIAIVVAWIVLGIIGVAIAGAAGGSILALVITGAAFYWMYRFSFYFPARATDRPLTLGEAARLSKGYFWRLMGACFMGAIVIILLMILYMVLGLLVLGMAAFVATKMGLNPVFGYILQFAFELPLILYFSPLATIAGVTALSNYYRLARAKT